MRPPSDEDLRRLARTDLETTYLIEAGAGTGKTAILVDRFVSCLLAGSPARRIVAITFTDKAAGELRFRVRRRLAELVSSAPGELAAEQRALAEEGLLDLDQAPISTIHAFAARLLRERPVDAGVDPAFEQLDAFGSALLFDELWEGWLAAVLGDGDGEAAVVRPMLRAVLDAGVGLETLRAIARAAFRARYDVVSQPQAPRPPQPAELLRPVLAAAGDLETYCAACCIDQADRGYLDAARVCAAALALQEALDGADLHEVAAALAGVQVKKSPNGQKRNWSGEGKAGLVRRYSAVGDAQVAALAAYGDYVARLALAAAWAFVRQAAAEQHRRGRLDFTDLLGRLRDALRDNRALRGQFQRAYDHILVDEFQDTDPLQVEALLFLAEAAPRATERRTVRLSPGKLFLVGDPKQSIYRFRRADISMYDEVKRLIQDQAGRVLAISQNFRTVPSVIAWVNHRFAVVIGADAAVGRQPAYVPLDPYRPEPVAEGRPRVVLLCEAAQAGRNAGERRRREAKAVASLIVKGVEGDWTVRAAASDAEESMRPAGWADVGVLLRAFSSVDVYERAFEQAGIPFRVEGGRAYYERREVADALLALHAVDDAADELATYAALHCTLFGFDDERLFLHKARGGSFDYLAQQPAGADPELAAALAVLRELHERRVERSIGETLAALLRDALAFEAAAAWGPGARQADANLRKLIDKARAFGAQRGASLHAFIRWAEQAAGAADEAESQVEEDGDVVRIMTIHAAKGLEFPVVVLGMGSGLGHAPDSLGVLLDRRQGQMECALKTTTSGSFSGAAPRELVAATRGHRALREAEDEMDASERRRLFYVAATRARDLLVVPVFGEPGKRSLLEPLAGRLPRPGEVTEEAVTEFEALTPAGESLTASPARRRPVPAVRAALAARQGWVDRRQALCAAASRPAPITSPSRLEEVESPEARADGEVRLLSRRDEALALGRAVHRLMEQVPLHDAALIPEMAVRCAAEEGVPELGGRVAELAAACWAAAPVREAVASPCVWRELPLSFVVADALVEGYADLLYRTPGGWVVVDYKTDAWPSEERVRRAYELQGGAYALAVETVSGEPVAAVRFVLAAAVQDGAARTLEVSVNDDLRQRTRRRIIEAAARDEDLTAGLR